MLAENLIEWGQRCGVRNWVIASAAEVYGSVDGAATEDSPTRPVIPYGEIKLRVERAFRVLADNGARVVILRIGEVYAPRGRLADELCGRLRGGFLPWPGHGQVPVSFVHVDDVAQAFLCATRASDGGVSIYNVADDEPTTWRRFLEQLAARLHSRKPVYLPLPLSRGYAAAARLGAALRRRETPVSPYLLRLLTTPKALSNRRIRDRLGFRPCFANCERGLEAMIDALSNHA